MLLPLAQGTDDAILWFRPELSRTVNWGGNPAEHVAMEPVTGRLSPRTSFAIWKETVRGRSAPWGEVDLALARDLRTMVEAEVARRAKAELAQFRHVDSLSGRPNRQRELERSNADLEEFAYAASHDLKAPLRAIGHLAQWIGEDLGANGESGHDREPQLLQGRVRGCSCCWTGCWPIRASAGTPMHCGGGGEHRRSGARHRRSAGAAAAALS